MASIFDRFARWTEHQIGHPATFAVACLSIILWGVTGPFFGGSDTWQLVINTGTTHRDLSDGLRDPERAKSGYSGVSAEARRVDPGECGRAEFADGLEERPESEIKELKSKLACALAQTDGRATRPVRSG